MATATVTQAPPRIRVSSGPLTATVDSMADWPSQERWYPATGPAGLSYFPGVTPLGVIDCLLWRSESGELIGILNHYPFTTPDGQVPGSVNFWVKPAWRRRGIGTRLLEEADLRWQLDMNDQALTAEGVATLTHAFRRHGIDVPSVALSSGESE